MQTAEQETRSGGWPRLPAPHLERALLIVGFHLLIVGYYVIAAELFPDIGSPRFGSVWTPGSYFGALGLFLLVAGISRAVARRDRRGPLIPPPGGVPLLFAVVGFSLVMTRGGVPEYW